MPSLLQVAETDFVRCLVYGPSSTGKTIFAASFPGPIKYWDFDNKVSSAAQFYRNDLDRLAQIDVTQFGPMSVRDRMNNWNKEWRVIAELANRGQPLPFKTLVLDSLTTFTNYLLEDYIKVSQTGIKRAHADLNAMQDYQLLDRHLTQIISSLAALPCNVVVIGHMQVEKDETTGALIRRPLMPGKFADKLNIYFEEVYVSKVKPSGDYVLQTKPDGTYNCRTQRRLPAEVPNSFNSLALK